MFTPLEIYTALKQTRKNNPGSISTPPKFFRSASLTGFTPLEMRSLSRSQDFRLLFKRGRRMEFGPFRIIVRKTAFSYSRFAFVVSRSVSPKATMRNRLRRRAKEWVRMHPLLFSQPIDAAIIFKKEVVGVSRKKFYEELSRAIRQIMF